MTLAFAVVALALFNVSFRLGRERLTEWDEALYATTAFEITESSEWIGTTFQGALDYYNSKPPLNVWLIALCIRTFGVSLMTLRLASAGATLLTVLVLLWWAWQRFSPPVGVFSALVLTTCFGFLHVHSGRSANPDALLTLLLLLIVVVLDSSRPNLRVWLGPLIAAVFLLKGMAIVMPLLLIAFMETRRRLEPRQRWLPLVAACAIFFVVVGAWAMARWRVDGWSFFERMFVQDFVAVSTTALDGQSGSPLFYLNILQKHHYDWILAAATIFVLFPPPLWRVRAWMMFWKTPENTGALLGAWSVITLLVPTLMQTKMPWYLNPFYPMFALGVGMTLSYGLSRVEHAPILQRRLLVAVVLLASVVAEGKLLWYSYAYRSLGQSAQGVLLLEAERLRGGTVFHTAWDRADAFVLKGIVQAERAESATVGDFVLRSGPNDYLVTTPTVERADLVRIRSYGNFALFQKQ